MEKLDQPESASLFNKGFFTVGVVVDKLGVRTSKSGKNFCLFKISDLEKYEMTSVRKSLT